MKYVKLISKGEWFKEGTEVMWDDCKNKISRRPTLEEWEELVTSNWPHAVFRGLRIVENPLSEGKWFEVGEEHDGDGEVCSCDEFDVEIVDEYFEKYN